MIGENLKRIRGFKGLQIQELAESAGVGETTIWKTETGKSTPNSKTLQKLADALQVDISIFYAKSLHLSEKEVVNG